MRVATSFRRRAAYVAMPTWLTPGHLTDAEHGRYLLL